MKISIITAVYNRADTIISSMDSIANQTYKNWEHIVVDGASTDGTLELIRSRLTDKMILISEVDNGIYDALNKGLSMANGDIIGILHSDDFLSDKNVLQDIVKKFSGTSVDATYGDLDYISNSKPDRVIRHWKAGQYRKSLLRRGWMPPHPTLFLRREVIDKLGNFDTRYKISADYDAMIRYLYTGNISLGYVERVLVKMRVGGESNKSLKKMLLKSKEDYQILRRNNLGGAWVLIYKNLRKVSQFFKK